MSKKEKKIGIIMGIALIFVLAFIANASENATLDENNNRSILGVDSAGETKRLVADDNGKLTISDTTGSAILQDIEDNQTDSTQKTQIVDPSGNASHATQDINGAWHIGTHIIQHNLVSSNNSSTTNLSANGEAGDEFIGTSESSSGAGLITVSLKTDKNCTVYIEQSQDGTNWDVSDSFDYVDYIDNFSTSVQVVGSYFRVRVQNEISSATTYFRLQSVIIPVGNPLPRSLDNDGDFKVSVQHQRDTYGFEREFTPEGDSRNIIPVSLVGTSFDDDTLDTNFWTSTVANGGTNTVTDGTLLVETNTTANGSAKVNSVRRASFKPGFTLLSRMKIDLHNTGVANNVRKWGIAYGSSMPTITDGAYFKLDGTTFSIEVLKNGTPTTINSGSFNGNGGTTYELDSTVHEYEIYYNDRDVYFSIDRVLVHTYEDDTDSWADTLEHHLYFESTNSNDENSNNVLHVRSASILRLGPLLGQAVSKYQSGTTAGLVLKYGGGNLHGIAISGVANNSVVTLYDNTAASGTIIWSSGAMPSLTTPFNIPFDGVGFSNGLTLVISGANSTVTVKYE